MAYTGALSNDNLKYYYLNFYVEHAEVYTKCLLEGNCYGTGYDESEVKYIINEIQKVILEQPKLNKNLILYRGIERDFIGQQKELVLKNFTSCVDSQEKANKYSGKNGVILELHVPIDIPIIYYENKDTYLLPYGIKVKIIDRNNTTCVLLVLQD